MTSLRIKTPSLSEVTAQLSGGNQQKVVIGKWVNTDADIFIFDEPTRGIDVGAKIEVYRIMNELVGAGNRHHGLVGTAENPCHERPRSGHARGKVMAPSTVIPSISILKAS